MLLRQGRAKKALPEANRENAESPFVLDLADAAPTPEGKSGRERASGRRSPSNFRSSDVESRTLAESIVALRLPHLLVTELPGEWCDRLSRDGAHTIAQKRLSIPISLGRRAFAHRTLRSLQAVFGTIAFRILKFL
jgi:hypothetical protein